MMARSNKKVVEKVKSVVEPEVMIQEQNDIDEQILFRKLILDNPGIPVFAIIRDTLDDSEPDRWNQVISKWIHKDYYIIISPGNDIRDGYLTEAGKLYARNKFNIS